MPTRPPPGCIAAATGLRRTNLSAVLHGLERKGLIERHATPGDRRGMIVRANPARKANYAMREAAEMIRAILRDARHSTG